MGLAENRETITSSQTSLPALISNFVGHFKGKRSSITSNASTTAAAVLSKAENNNKKALKEAKQNQSSFKPTNQVQSRSIHSRADCNRCNNNCSTKEADKAVDEGHDHDEAKVTTITTKVGNDNNKQTSNSSGNNKRRASFRTPLVIENSSSSKECGLDGAGFTSSKRPTIWTNVKSAFKGSNTAAVGDNRTKKKVTCAEPLETVAAAGRDSSVRRSYNNGKKLRISPDSIASQRLVSVQSAPRSPTIGLCP
jgi:hypothetical protein